MERVFASGWMESNTWGNGRMGKDMVMDFGQLSAEAKRILESGRKEKYMVMVNTLRKIIPNLKDISKIS